VTGVGEHLKRGPSGSRDWGTDHETEGGDGREALRMAARRCAVPGFAFRGDTALRGGGGTEPPPHSGCATKPKINGGCGGGVTSGGRCQL